VNTFIHAMKFGIRVVLSMVGIIILIILICYILLVIELSKTADALSSRRFSQSVNFSDPNKRLFINTATWGLAGNHEYIFFSDSEKYHPDKNSDLIFNESYLFYKVDKDELIIWTDQRNARLGTENIILPKNIIFIGINTQINSFPSYEKSREFEAMHKELGFFKASIFSEVIPPYLYDEMNTRENAKGQPLKGDAELQTRESSNGVR